MVPVDRVDQCGPSKQEVETTFAEIEGRLRRRVNEAMPDDRASGLGGSAYGNAGERAQTAYGAPLSEPITLENVEAAMQYHPWGVEQLEAGNQCRESLTAAIRTILRTVPNCPLRTRAINHLVDARMIANAAITFRGRF